MDGKFGWWFAGLTDGEGNFDIKPIRNRTRGTEYFVCRFTIGLRADDQPLLEYVQRELGGIGDLRIQRMPSAYPQARWEVARKREVAALAEVFDEYPPRSKKADDFAVWREAVTIWATAVRGNRHHGRSPHTEQMGRLRTKLRAARSLRLSPHSASGTSESRMAGP